MLCNAAGIRTLLSPPQQIWHEIDAQADIPPLSFIPMPMLAGTILPSSRGRFRRKWELRVQWVGR